MSEEPGAAPLPRRNVIEEIPMMKEPSRCSLNLKFGKVHLLTA